jgi:hypothetical protein
LNNKPNNNMKYIKGSTINNRNVLACDINILAGEMVNTMTGTTYYVNGVLVDKPMPGYNTYTIGSVEFELHPNIGCVILLSSESSIASELEIKSKELFELVAVKFNKRPKLSPGMKGTTQYIYIDENRESNAAHIVYCVDVAATPSPNSRGVFTWYIYTMVGLNKSPLYIPFLTGLSIPREEKQLSLCTVLYDGMSALNLPNGYKSPNFPLYSDYSNYSKGIICDKPIIVDVYAGINIEIAKNFVDIKSTDQFGKLGTVMDNIYWIRWENVKPRKSSNDIISWVDQIKLAAQQELPYYDNVDVKSADDTDTGMSVNTDNMDATADIDTKYNISDGKNSDKFDDYKCFITGIPIYQDCYVLDIYQQEIDEQIDIKDLDTALSAGAKLYQEPVVVQESKKKTKVLGGKAQNAKGKRGKKLQATKKVKKTSSRRRESDSENSDNDTGITFESKEDNSDDDEADEVDDTSNLEEKKTSRVINGVSVNVKKLPKKKGGDAVETVKITQTIIHKEPVHILVSPFAMHYIDKTFTAAGLLEKLTRSKAIIYRTFCPRTCKDVINSLPDEVGQTYKNALHAFNKSANMKTVNGWTYLKATDQTREYNLVSSVGMMDVLQPATGKVLCINADKYSRFM